MIWIKTEEEVMTVTEYYLQIIGTAFERLNQKVTYTSDLKNITPQSGDTVVLCTAPGVLHFLRKDIKVIYWAQGAWPEESFMRYASKIRFFLTSMIEKAALKRANFTFFVSDPMRSHFEKKYQLSFHDHYYIMPCSNEDFHPASFMTPNKYDRPVFCYAGGTSVWQCFEETVALYADIERMIPESRLLLLVKDRSYALEVLHKYGVKHFEIDYVSVEELPNILKNVTYGFILRKKSVVNTVATPTKTLTYLANGVIPIYSDSLCGIHEILKKTNYKIEISDMCGIHEIAAFCKKAIDSADVLKEYQGVYQESYSRENHIRKMAERFLKSGLVEE